MSMTYSTIDKPRCKRCAMQFIQPSHEHGAVETLLRWFSLYAFRCQLCKHRFYRLLKRSGRTPEAETDKREYLRVPVTFPVTFSGEQLHGEGTVINLSIRGCAMESTSRPRSGSILNLTLQPQEYRPPIRIDRAIVRSGMGKRFGLEFLQVHAADEERLRRAYYRQATMRAPDETGNTNTPGDQKTAKVQRPPSNARIQTPSSNPG